MGEPRTADMDALIANTIECGEVNFVLIREPRALGTTYDEVIANLNKLAKAGLTLALERPSSR